MASRPWARPSAFEPLSPSNRRPGPAIGVGDAGLDAPGSCGPPTPPAVNRHVGGVGVHRATHAEQGSPGPSRADRGRGETACARVDARVPASVSAPIPHDGQARAETPPHHDLLLALLRHVIADG